MQLNVIHNNRTSFNKYMKKCVEILIEYLAVKSNLNSQFVLALQWRRLISSSTTTTTATVPLNRQQIASLFESILKHVITAASTYLLLADRNAAKSKVFGDFFLNVYDLFKACENHLRQSQHFRAYSDIMITCYRLYNNDDNVAATDVNNNDEFQKALELGAMKKSEKTKKNSNKPPNKDTQQVQVEN